MGVVALALGWANAQEPAHEVWAGTLSVVGTRSIPLLGTVEYRTDTHVLAVAIQVAEDRWSVTQQVCDLNFSKALGATVRVAPDATRSIPPTRFDWVRGPDGMWSTVWLGGWNDTDFDKDGKPGISFHVGALVCGGTLHIASAARNEATADAPGPHNGKLKIWTEQQILATEGACLKVMAKDRKEWLYGRYSFVVAPDATCEVPGVIWPDPFLK